MADDEMAGHLSNLSKHLDNARSSMEAMQKSISSRSEAAPDPQLTKSISSPAAVDLGMIKSIGQK